MNQHFLPFVGLVTVLVAIPGPAVTLIMKNALVRGARLALLTALGVFIADLLWLLASILGVTALLVASAPAFQALKLLGAGYLIYLGVRLLLSRHDALPDPRATAVAPLPTGISPAQAFREGLLCDLSNPKTVLIFTSVIPQFLPAGAGVVDTVVLGGSFALLGLVSLVIYAWTFARTRQVVARPRLTRVLVRSSGGLLVAFGIDVALQRR